MTTPYTAATPPGAAAPLYRRFFPAGVPAELAAIGTLLLAGGLSALLGYLVLCVDDVFTPFGVVKDSHGFDFSPGEGVFMAAISLAGVFVAVGLMRGNPKSLAAGIGLCLVQFFFTMGMPNMAFSSEFFLRAVVETGLHLTHLIVSILILGASVFLLYYYHIRNADRELSERIAQFEAQDASADEDKPEETGPRSLTIPEHLVQIDIVRKRIFANGLTPVVLIVALVVLRDALAQLSSNLLMAAALASPAMQDLIGVGFYGDLPRSVAAAVTAASALVGLVGAAAGIGLIRRQAWARGAAGLFLIAAAVLQCVPAVQAILAPADFTLPMPTVIIRTICMGTVIAWQYAMFHSLLAEDAPAGTPGVKVV